MNIMNYLIKKRLDSICSDTSVSSINNSLDDSYESSRPDETKEDFFADIEDVGVTVDIDIVDGRLDHPTSRTMLRVEPVDEDGELVCVRLETNHHSFSRGRSVTIRSFQRFYSLQRLLRVSYNFIMIIVGLFKILSVLSGTAPLHNHPQLTCQTLPPLHL